MRNAACGGSTDDNQKEEELLEYFLETNLELLDECTEPTFITINGRKIVDITLCSQWQDD